MNIYEQIQLLIVLCFCVAGIVQSAKGYKAHQELKERRQHAESRFVSVLQSKLDHSADEERATAAQLYPIHIIVETSTKDTPK